MATIDYKEKYEQALERARQFSEKPYLEDSAGIVEYIFPELKESDDERIRKELIFYFQEEIPQCSIQEHADKMKEFIAWLEKGEQNPAWSEADEEQLSFCCAAIELSNYSSDEYRNHAISFLESLKDRVQPQPKQEWSEEDETMIALLHNIISHQYSMDIIKKEEQLKLEDWLKSLRPQNTWKPSDEQMDN